MYTEKAVELKTDFYCRYGRAKGELFFEKVGLPCSVLEGNDCFLAFSFDCGVNVYGRGYGDIIKVMDAKSNICDIHFVKNGRGAQVLYELDMADITGMREIAGYAINKLLCKMGLGSRLDNDYTTASVCDRYAPKGWAALKLYDEIKSVPFPMFDYNVLLLRTRRTAFRWKEEDYNEFSIGEKNRIGGIGSYLRECNMNYFFDTVNESEASFERTLEPPEEMVQAVAQARSADGVTAVKICNMGIVVFCDKNKTDAAIRSIRLGCLKRLGYEVRIAVVK